MKEEKLQYELERLRREHDLSIAKLKQEHYLEIFELQEKIISLEHENSRKTDIDSRQDQQISTLVELGKKMEDHSRQAITPNQIRHWMVVFTSFILAVLLIISIAENYQQAQFIKYEERRWAEAMRQQKID